MVNTIEAIELIATNPIVRNGRPFIIGTTITVADIIIAKQYHYHDADEIAELFDLSLPQVYAALAYYYNHKRQIDNQIRQQILKATQLKNNRVGSRHSLLPR